MADLTTEQQPENAGPELEEIERQAAALDAGPEQQQAQREQEQEQAEALTAAAELRGVLGLARLAARPAFSWWSDFEKVWSDRQLEAISEAGAAVMARHNWTMGGLMAEWGPYIALIGATAGPALATFAAVQERRAATVEAAPTPQRQPSPDGRL